MQHFKEYEKCTLCPRQCGIDRNKGKKGFCGETASLKVARAALHMWEEPCISGENGSGTVFFSGCTLKCSYCQNFDLSRNKCGKEITHNRLAEIFLELQDKGAHNINLVTGEHFAPHIKYAVNEAKKNGLKIPIVFNCGGYVSTSVLEYLSECIDIYLPDFKYFYSETAQMYSAAPDYREIAEKAINKMVSLQPRLVYDEKGILKRGVVVRHMCLPGRTQESKEILGYLYDKYVNNICVSIMNQYTPMENVKEDRLLKRKLSEYEYEKILDFCIALGIENAYIQEGGAAEESFIPKFDCEGV